MSAETTTKIITGSAVYHAHEAIDARAQRITTELLTLDKTEENKTLVARKREILADLYIARVGLDNLTFGQVEY